MFGACRATSVNRRSRVRLAQLSDGHFGATHAPTASCSLAVRDRDRGALNELYRRHESWLTLRLSYRCSDRGSGRGGGAGHVRQGLEPGRAV